MILALAAALSFAAPALADDDDRPTAAQRTAVMKAINAAGCTGAKEIERDDGGYEVDDARCRDGVFDLKLSADYRIVSRDREDDRD